MSLGRLITSRLKEETSAVENMDSHTSKAPDTVHIRLEKWT